MTYEELELQYKQDLANQYPQYMFYLNGPIRIVEAVKKRSSKGIWYEKNDKMLAFDLPEVRNCWNRVTRKFDKQITFIRVYSFRIKSICLAPITDLKVLEIKR